MSLPCRLSSHAAAPQVLRNQGFAFSRCRRCGRDMIRSLGSSETTWRTVPAGFRVDWKNAGVNRALDDCRRTSLPRRDMGSSLVADFLRITTAALYWKIRDYASEPLSHHDVVLRISGS